MIMTLAEAYCARVPLLHRWFPTPDTPPGKQAERVRVTEGRRLNQRKAI